MALLFKVQQVSKLFCVVCPVLGCAATLKVVCKKLRLNNHLHQCVPTGVSFPTEGDRFPHPLLLTTSDVNVPRVKSVGTAEEKSRDIPGLSGLLQNLPML